MKAPSIRIILLVFIGLICLRVLWWWDGRLDEQERAHRDRVAVVLSTSAAMHRWADSVRQVTDSLASLDSALRAAEELADERLRSLEFQNARELVELAATPLDDLLPSLRLTARGVRPGDPPEFVTDSAGVRFLADRMLRLRQAERRAGTLGDLAAAREARIAALEARAVGLALRADSAESRLRLVEPLLEESARRLARKGRIFGFLPRPPAELALAGGVLIGILVSR